jgi:hypothetical protein
MTGVLRVQGRELNEADLAMIRGWRASHPQWSRYYLSVALAEHWQWRNEAGRLKDMAARTLLLKLERRGLIELPAPLRRNGRSAAKPPSTQEDLPGLEPQKIEFPLRELQPLKVEVAQSLPQRRRVGELLARYHYLGFRGAVGENVQYLIRDAQGRELAVLVYGAAAWKVAPRDAWIGWSPRQRAAGLGRIANQQRFLVLPWVRVPHLASHLLALIHRRLSSDWQSRYGHAVWLVETFVEEPRFTGTVYRAANWFRLGRTTGRTRQDRDRTLKKPIKSVWVQPLHRRWQEKLHSVAPPKIAPPKS